MNLPFEPDYQFVPGPGVEAFRIGVVGAGFIVRDCHLVAYQNAGYQVAGITSRTRSKADEVAALRNVPQVYDSVEAMIASGDVSVLDIAVPPQHQPDIIRRVAARPGSVQGILAQKPLAMSLREGRQLVELCENAGITLAVNQNMRHDHSVRAARSLLAAGVLGDPVLATIDMRAIPHWMPWSESLHSLSTFIMSIHHLDCFRYWLGNPERVMASTRSDPRTPFRHTDGVNLYILEFADGARASSWDDVWSGPAREGSAADIGIRWRIEGTEGLARGTIGWPSYPEKCPSTIDFTARRYGSEWFKPRWTEAWFPDAFAGTMGELLAALRDGSPCALSGRDNLQTLALVESVFKAAHEHRVVTLKETLEVAGL